ncbi:MAG: AraC family transcriptional regulator ligand-binding domain-containing protein [Pseudomonadota bacterium]
MMPLKTFTPDDPVIPMSYPGFVFRVLRRQGYPADALLSKTGLVEENLESSEFRTIFKPIQRLFENALSTTQNPHLGITIALRFEPANIGLPAHTAMNAPSFGAGLDVLARFLPLNFPSLDIAVVSDRSDLTEDEAAICLRSKFPYGDIEYFMFSSALVAINSLLNAMRKQEHTLSRAQAMVSRPEGWSDVDHQLNCPVTFDETENLLVFPRFLLDEPLPGSDPINHARLLMLCEQLAATAAYEATPVTQVMAILEAHPNLTLQLSDVAMELGYSERSLRRQLDRSGTSYRRLMDQVRETRARALLSGSTQPIKSIAGALGFESSSNFARSFKRWTGLTPKAFRDRAEVQDDAGRK